MKKDQFKLKFLSTSQTLMNLKQEYLKQTDDELIFQRGFSIVNSLEMFTDDIKT